MHYSKLTVLIPCTLLLGVYTTVTPVCKDNDTRNGPYVGGDPDNVTQQFYNYHILHHNNDTTTSRPYLSDRLATLLSDASRDDNHQEPLTNDPFSSRTTLPESARVVSASTIPNRDTRNIPLCVDLKKDDQSRQDEVLIIQEGQCWVVDDVRYLGGNAHATAGTLRQSIENR